MTSTTTISTMSLITPGVTVTVDPYGRNPLAEDFRSVSPALYASAVQRNGRPPKLFTSGALHLPPITASGVDPTFLGWLPFGVRHHAADLATEAEFQNLAEQCASNPAARIDHPGLDAAIARVRAWANGPTPDATTTVIKASTGQQPKGGAGGQNLVHGMTHQEVMALSRRGVCLPRGTTRPDARPTRIPLRPVAERETS